MAQTERLVTALKDVLKSRGITYAKLARKLGLSEASVKRIFASRSFTLRRLDQVCETLGMEVSDLAKMVTVETDTPVRLTREQENELVSDAALLLVAVHALNHWSVEELLEVYALTRAQCIKLLVRLDRMGLIDLLPNDRIRVRVARDFAWLPHGPIHQYIMARAKEDFFRSRFEGEGEMLAFVNGMLSDQSNTVIRSRLRRLRAEFGELHHNDIGLPLSQRFGTSLLLAVRPWAPDAFVRMRNKTARRTRTLPGKTFAARRPSLAEE
jgi:DNA-binding Xre family transcriptional regulator